MVFKDVSLEPVPGSEGGLAALTSVGTFPGVQKHVANKRTLVAKTQGTMLAEVAFFIAMNL